MKKHLIVIALLTITSTKLVSMQDDPSPDTQQKILVAVKTLFTLADVPTDNLSNFEEKVLQKLPNFINTTEDRTKLREGIFAITSLLIFIESENPGLRTLKTLRKSLYNRLTEILLKDEKEFPPKKDAKLRAKDFCWDVIDDISDAEDEVNYKKHNYTQNNFDKYKVITGKILNTEIYKNELNTTLEKFQNTQIVNSFQIETLTAQIEDIKKANDELNKKIIYSQKESEALNIAQVILQDKASNQLKKMKKQREWLINQISCTNDNIANLQKEEPTNIPKYLLDGTNKKKLITNAHKKLAELQNALSYLDKNFAEIHGKTGIVSNIAWNLGLYNYGNPNQETKKN